MEGSPPFFFSARIEVEGRKGEGVDRGMERRRRRELILGVTLAVTSGNKRPGGERTLSFLPPFYLPVTFYPS